MVLPQHLWLCLRRYNGDALLSLGLAATVSRAPHGRADEQAQGEQEEHRGNVPGATHTRKHTNVFSTTHTNCFSTTLSQPLSQSLSQIHASTHQLSCRSERAEECASVRSGVCVCGGGARGDLCVTGTRAIKAHVRDRHARVPVVCACCVGVCMGTRVCPCTTQKRNG